MMYRPVQLEHYMQRVRFTRELAVYVFFELRTQRD
jgi:hypothetical protein